MRSAELLKEARVRRNLTQREFASAAGVPQSVIARYEAGTVKPSLEKLEALLGRIGMRLQVGVEPIKGGPDTRSLRPHGHQVAEQRSLGYHRLIAERLMADPVLLDRARARVDGWLAGTAPFAGSRQYAEAWRRVLQHPLQEVVRLMLADDERGRDLRQNAPFAGLLTPREISQIIRDTPRSRGAHRDPARPA